MEVLNGLTFSEARKRVKIAFKESIRNSTTLTDDRFSFNLIHNHQSFTTGLPTVLVILLYSLALILAKFQQADLLVVVCIVTFVLLLNGVVMSMYRQSEKRELSRSIHDILQAYENSCNSEQLLEMSGAMDPLLNPHSEQVNYFIVLW